jgi:rSAM/selenodomain-associated transferase 1
MPDRSPRVSTLLGLFAKHWEPGKVKTRLAASIGDNVAAEIHRVFLETLLDRFASVAGRRLLAFAPLDAEPAFVSLQGDTWELAGQSSGDLGRRMRVFFESALEEAERVVLIGSDSPDLPAERLEEAFASLATHDVVLGPAVDGGYYLIGVARRVPPIFQGIAWSTSDVWPQTVSRLKVEGVDWHELPKWYDVDDEAGLNGLMERLETAQAADGNLLALKNRLHALLK